MYTPLTDTGDLSTFVDLRSDTVTRPSQAMRERMMAAEVGDDVIQEDPTVSELECRMAEILGKESGLFVTSGSQGNLLSNLVHCTTRGAEMICGDKNHIFLYEQGSMAQFGGIQASPVEVQKDGSFSLEGIRNRIRDHTNDHYPKTCLIAVETTQNYHGGVVPPLEWVDEVNKLAKEHGIPTHLDGARLFNAALTLGVPAGRIARDFSSVTVCLSKGLGAPGGSILCGNAEFIRKARRLRKALGSGMRQIGILAAAGLYCLDHMIDRLAVDHENAQLVAKAINAVNSPVISVDMDRVQSNMVLIDVDKSVSAADVCKRLGEITDEERVILKDSAVRVLAWERDRNNIRLVLHCDVSREQAERAANKICLVVKEFSQKS